MRRPNSISLMNESESLPLSPRSGTLLTTLGRSLVVATKYSFLQKRPCNGGNSFDWGGWKHGRRIHQFSQRQVVAIVARSMGLWWLNACRIVYVIDEEEPIRRYGFAYGTLPDHAGSGEERFLIEMDETGDVWYDILAFSRPHHILARLGYPAVRVVQKRFGRESAVAMIEAVKDSNDHNPQGNAP